VIETYKLLGFHLNKNKEGRFTFHVPNTASISYKIAIGNTIVDAYRRCINWLGKPQVVPPKEYFTDPIFNTWIEFFWDVNQKGLLTYAQNIRTHGFPASILDIDDKWSTKYGDFDFDPAKFPDPEGLIAQLKEMKFKMALWVTPFIEPAARNYNYALSKKYLLMDEKGKKPYITKWWNGSAALIDLSNPEAHAWYLDQLKALQRKYGVSGFKLDAGDAEFLIKPFKSYGNISANRYTDLFAELGKHFEVNELRVSWLTQRLGLVQRLRDKAPNWEKEEGLGTIVPHGMAESLIGYPYFCPDMIGGGLESGFKENKIDAELFVRWTQASALMPMMQYSYAPWKLDSTSVSICLKYSKLHTDLGDYIYSLARQASVDGMPITRPLFFVDPADQNTYTISDQFMLGEKLLVAPVLKKGAVSRDIYLPKGTWSDLWTGRIYQGNTTLQHFSAPIDILPVFVKIY
jgi:alpha-glucosidase (family GH31 glycosyl hydrolase)